MNRQDADFDACEAAIRHGSLSFHAASMLLPTDVRRSALALYAFCRLADDAVDLQPQKADAVMRLNERLELAYGGRPLNTAIDRAFTAMIEKHAMPRALPDALLEGFAWDAMGRRYDSFSDVKAYSARVASAVGAMMSVLMGVRDRHALARACDLGVAMQLTNIARDIGEDAREGRLYLPLDWLSEAGIDAEAFLANPKASPALASLARRLVREADELYARSEAGISMLPFRCRPGIYGARFIYAGIGKQLARNGFESINTRARTTKAQKIGWLGWSALRTGLSPMILQSPRLYARALPEVAFLVDAAAAPERCKDRSHAILDALATLEAASRDRKAALIGPGSRTNP